MKPSRKQIIALWLIGSGLIFTVLIVISPQLRFVDFISFSERAQRILKGDDWYHGLYPVGYPVVLGGTKFITGNVLFGGKILSVIGALILLRCVLFWKDSAGALAVVSCASFWLWGQIEGTDMLAAGLTIGAILLAKDKPFYACGLWCAAFLTRYTAIAGLPFVIWLSPSRLRTLLLIALGTSPHWATALWLGKMPLINQTENFARSPENLFIRSTWGPIRGLASLVAADPFLVVGSCGWIYGIKDSAGKRLLLFGFIHLLMISMVFTQPRLLLPVSLVLGMGWVWLIPVRRFVWCLPVLCCLFGIYRSGQVSPEIKAMNQASLKSPVNDRFLSLSPWFFYFDKGWVNGGLPLREVSRPEGLTGDQIERYAKQNSFHFLVIHSSRIRGPYRNIASVLEHPSLTLSYEYGAWRVYQIQ